MGLREVAIFRASGNVVFAADRSEIGQQPPAELAARIERGLAAALGYEVPTFIRTAAEVRVIAATQPFAFEHVRASAGKLQVAMLSERPSPSARRDVLSLAGDDDRLAIAIAATGLPGYE